MSDTNSWNYYGNTGALAVKSKYVQPDLAPIQDDPVAPTPPDDVPDAGGTTSTSYTPDEPQEAPVDTNN